jgi:hypothetical protein
MEHESLELTIVMDDGRETEVLARLARLGRPVAGSAGYWPASTSAQRF